METNCGSKMGSKSAHQCGSSSSESDDSISIPIFSAISWSDGIPSAIAYGRPTPQIASKRTVRIRRISFRTRFR